MSDSDDGREAVVEVVSEKSLDAGAKLSRQSYSLEEMLVLRVSSSLAAEQIDSVVELSSHLQVISARSRRRNRRGRHRGDRDHDSDQPSTSTSEPSISISPDSDLSPPALSHSLTLSSSSSSVFGSAISSTSSTDTSTSTSRNLISSSHSNSVFAGSSDDENENDVSSAGAAGSEAEAEADPTSLLGELDGVLERFRKQQLPKPNDVAATTTSTGITLLPPPTSTTVDVSTFESSLSFAPETDSSSSSSSGLGSGSGSGSFWMSPLGAPPSVMKGAAADVPESGIGLGQYGAGPTGHSFLGGLMGMGLGMPSSTSTSTSAVGSRDIEDEIARSEEDILRSLSLGSLVEPKRESNDSKQPSEMDGFRLTQSLPMPMPMNGRGRGRGHGPIPGELRGQRPGPGPTGLGMRMGPPGIGMVPHPQIEGTSVAVDALFTGSPPYPYAHPPPLMMSDPPPRPPPDVAPEELMRDYLSPVQFDEAGDLIVPGRGQRGGRSGRGSGVSSGSPPSGSGGSKELMPPEGIFPAWFYEKQANPGQAVRAPPPPRESDDDVEQRQRQEEELRRLGLLEDFDLSSPTPVRHQRRVARPQGRSSDNPFLGSGFGELPTPESLLPPERLERPFGPGQMFAGHPPPPQWGPPPPGMPMGGLPPYQAPTPGFAGPAPLPPGENAWFSSLFTGHPSESGMNPVGSQLDQ